MRKPTPEEVALMVDPTLASEAHAIVAERQAHLRDDPHGVKEALTRRRLANAREYADWKADRLAWRTFMSMPAYERQRYLAAAENCGRLGCWSS